VLHLEGGGVNFHEQPRTILLTMSYGAPDRIPCFDEGMREETLETWHTQGLPIGVDLTHLITIDWREEIEPEMRPLPDLSKWPTTRAGLDSLQQMLDPDDPARLPEGWIDRLRAWRDRHTY